MKYKFNNIMGNALNNLQKNCSNIKLISELNCNPIKWNKCFFLSDFIHNKTQSVCDKLDNTSLECFVNSFHINEYVNSNYLNEAICFIEHVLSIWKKHSPKTLFEGHISFGIDTPDDIIVKIHAVRNYEAKCSVDDLNEYKFEGVLHIIH